MDDPRGRLELVEGEHLLLLRRCLDDVEEHFVVPDQAEFVSGALLDRVGALLQVAHLRVGRRGSAGRTAFMLASAEFKKTLHHIWRPAMMRRHLVCVVLWLAAGLAHAVPIASSIPDFSNVQGQDGWRYGFFNQGVDNATAYNTAAFEDFSTFGIVDAGVWGASDGQVGVQNNVYLGLGSATGHPTGLAPPDVQDRIIWAVRRYVSEVAGDIDIKIDLRKFNDNANGGGVTGRVFVDGVEVYTQFVAATDLSGFQTTLVRNVALNSLIDFAIDPLGVAINLDGIYSPRADGTHFSAEISPHAVPIAPTFLLMIGGLMGLIASRRYRPA